MDKNSFLSLQLIDTILIHVSDRQQENLDLFEIEEFLMVRFTGPSILLGRLSVETKNLGTLEGGSPKDV